MGLDPRTLSLCYTDDFDGAVRRLTGSTTYSSDRGTGTVAAKTIDTKDDSTIIINAAATQHLDDAVIERTAAHECGHVLLNRRGEAFKEHDDAAAREWESHLTALASFAVEEYRVEKSLAERGYPPSGACDPAHVAWLLHSTTGDLLELIHDAASTDPLHLCRGVVAQADRISKVLAYSCAYDLDGPYRSLLAKEGEPAAQGWAELIAPSWSLRAELYAGIPSASMPISAAVWRQQQKAAMAVEHALVQGLGFVFRDEVGGGWGFYPLLNDAELMARAHRYLAQESLYEAAG